LKRIEKLFGERARRHSYPAARRRTLNPGAGRGYPGCEHPAAFLDIVLMPQAAGQPSFPAISASARADELGCSHGSTIIVLAPDHFEFCDNIVESARILAGQPLMRKPAAAE